MGELEQMGMECTRTRDNGLYFQPPGDPESFLEEMKEHGVDIHGVDLEKSEPLSAEGLIRVDKLSRAESEALIGALKLVRAKRRQASFAIRFNSKE
jgi:hypothetical protein